MSHIIGIDLGTTNSVVSFIEGGKCEVITNSEGEKTTPSIVMFRNADEVIVGALAKRQLVSSPASTIRSVKRIVGRRFEEINQKINQFAYKIVPDENGNALIDLGWGKITPEQVSAEILKKMKITAEDFLHEDITQAVITVPAYFNDGQRASTKAAAELAGLEVMRIINEPTAAALAYGLNKNKEESVAVFDFGGGTFDISILELNNDIFEVKSTNGDTELGGDNIDHLMYDYIKSMILKETDVDIEKDIQAVQRVIETAEKVKCELSTLRSTIISLPFIGYSESGPKHFNYEIKRDEFEHIIEPLYEKLLAPCRQAIEDSHINIERLNTVLLVGGSTRIPAIQRLVREFFKREPSKEVNPDEAVSIGAAIQASVMSGALQEVLLLDITPLSLGIELAGGVFSSLIPRNSSIPTTATKKFTTVVDNQDTVYVHILQGERKLASENRSLGHFRLKGIPSMPREIPEVEVKFHIDANGILNVSARDCTSGISKEMLIESYLQLPLKDVEKVVREAEQKSKEDSEMINFLRIKNAARDIIQNILAFIEDQRERISEENLKALKEAAMKLEVAIHQNRTAEIPELQGRLIDVADNYGDLFLPYKTGEYKKLKQRKKPGDVGYLSSEFDLQDLEYENIDDEKDK